MSILQDYNEKRCFINFLTKHKNRFVARLARTRVACLQHSYVSLYNTFCLQNNNLSLSQRLTIQVLFECMYRMQACMQCMQAAYQKNDSTLI